jgi:spermidine synthase
VGNTPLRPAFTPKLLSILFLASGFSSLLLEVTWARILTQMTGTGVRATATVAAVTLAGIALGSWLGGRRCDRLEAPLRAYAWVEMGIGGWALLTPALCAWLVRLAPHTAALGSGELDRTGSSLLTSVLLVLPGSLLMGATTPLVVRADLSLAGANLEDQSAGRRLGRLYGWNTLGGSVGALGAAFIILPAMGLRSTCFFAAGINTTVAALALLMASRWINERPAVGSFARGEDRIASLFPRSAGNRITLPALFFAGALGAACQVCWTRLLVLFFGSSVQALGVTLAAGLAGLALGSAGCARALRKTSSPERISSTLAGAATTLMLLSLPLWGGLPVLAALAQVYLGASFAGALALQAFLCALLILPTAAAFGALLPALTASLRSRLSAAGRTVGSGYALDSAGSVFGGLAAVFVLLPRWGVEALLRGAIVNGALLFVFLTLSHRRGLGRILRVAMFAGILTCCSVMLPSWDPVLLTSGPLLYSAAYVRAGGMSWKGVRETMRKRGALVFLDEGADATVSVRRTAAGNLSLQINGKTDASDGGDLPAQILAGEIPALLHATPSRVLVIGLASGTTAGSLAGHPVERLDCVEISPGVARAARLFESANHGVLEDPRFHLLLGDGRTYLQQTSQLFDLIVSQPTNPWVAGVTNLFTAEFFRIARERLAPGGILAVWVQGYAMQPDDFKSIVTTFQQVFPQCQLWEESAGGGDYYLVGRRGGSPPNLQEIAGRMEISTSVEEGLSRAGIATMADFLTRFIASGEALERFARSAPPISDDNVRLEFTAPREIWSNRLPQLLASLEAIRQSAVTVFPELSDPSRKSLRASLADLERQRGARIRWALSIGERDLEALASPSLSAALNLIRMGAAEKAPPLLRRARHEAPLAPVVPLLLGWTLLNAGKVEEAEPAFREALTLDPRSSGAAEGLGLSLYRQGNLKEAAKAFQAAVTYGPGDADPLANLGAVFLAQGRYGDALELMDQALRIDPRHLSARINRGVTLARLGRISEAIREYELALEMDPQSEDALYNLQRAKERLQGK